MSWRTVHVSDPEGLDAGDGGLLKWKDDAPVRETVTERGAVRLVFDDGRDRQVVRR